MAGRGANRPAAGASPDLLQRLRNATASPDPQSSEALEYACDKVQLQLRLHRLEVDTIGENGKPLFQRQFHTPLFGATAGFGREDCRGSIEISIMCSPAGASPPPAPPVGDAVGSVAGLRCTDMRVMPGERGT